MVSLATTLKPLSPFSSFVKQHKTSNNNAFSTYRTHTYIQTQVSSNEEAPSPCLTRNIRSWVFMMHQIRLRAPGGYHCRRLWWSERREHFGKGVGIIGIFDLPKWLEYLLAYGGLLAFQGDTIEWVSNHRYHHKHCDTQRDPHSPTQGFWFSHMAWIFDSGHIHKKCGGQENANDLVRQPFYKFLQRTILLHEMAFALLLYICGRMPFLVWGIGVVNVARYHGTFLVNSVCHTWGTRAWNTPDLSKNNLWVAAITFGEGWHNNHHAFEFSARHGLEWWQLDFTWYLIKFLEAIGLATNVKLPFEAKKKTMACN
ncbi:unnamed protein product [Brassica napus]|uniref:(rape) hypothetical protein n=1 Tax=Brassica napus TaxID=3708 RepID=A0A816IEF7_BRANA|nr:unnamed protein product [Brassica napus]